MGRQLLGVADRGPGMRAPAVARRLSTRRGHALPLRTRPARFAGFRQRANVNGLTAAEHRPIAVIVTAAVTVTVTAAVTVALIVTVDVAFTVTLALTLTLTLTLTDH